MFRWRTFAAALACASIVSRAQAQDQPQPRVDNRARAQELFDSALADAEAGNFSAACPKFLASQTADPKTSTLLNLANCYEKNGQTASAWGAFREAETAAHNLGRNDWESAAHARADALEPKLVRLTIEVPDASRIDGLTIMRDGAKLSQGEWGVAIPVDPGEHVVFALADGHETAKLVANVAGESKTITVPVLAPLPPPEPRLPQAPMPIDRPNPPLKWWTTMRTTGVAVGGAGVLAMGTGLVLGLVAKGNYDDARNQCTSAPHFCPSSAVSSANGAYSLATGATVAFIVGAAMAAAGGALILLAPDEYQIVGARW